jgi:pimeloyl-ACP methyl ester carboxylesterase
LSGPVRAGGRPGELVRLDGIDVHHTVTGSGPPDVLLLHHFYGNVATWRRVTDRLADDARLVAFDRPGFGWTPRPPRSRWNGTNPYTRESAVHLGLALLEAYAIERAVVVGASAGGTVALQMAAAHPERVAGLVLLAPAIGGDVGPPARYRRVLRSGPARAVARTVIPRVAGSIDHGRIGGSWADASRVTDADVAAYAALFDQPRWAAGLWEVMTAEPPPALWDALAGIDVPVLVVSGAQDRVVHPRWAREAARRLPQGRYVTLADCGHTPHEECPDAVAAHIRDFLRRPA